MSQTSEVKTSKQETIIGIASLVILFDLGIWVLYILMFTDLGQKYADYFGALAFVLMNFMVLPFILLFHEISQRIKKIMKKTPQKKKQKTQQQIELEKLISKIGSKEAVEYQQIMNQGNQLKEEKCSICKLNIKPLEIIVQCSECLSLFHKEHLDDWLEKTKKCPVCSIDLYK